MCEAKNPVKDGTTPFPPNAYEVGFAFVGCTDVDAQRDALQKLIDDCGDEKREWHLPPEVREYHNHDARITLNDFGRKIEVDRSECRWAVYGVRLYRPTDLPHHVPEGVHLPLVIPDNNKEHSA